MDNELIAEAELGEEARKFLDSDLGRCLLGMAEQEATLAEKALGKIDPKDEAGIVALQRKVQVAEWFEDWLRELVDRGNAALEIFKQQKDDNG